MQWTWKLGLALGSSAMAAAVLAGGRPVVAGHAFDPYELLPVAEMVSYGVAVGDVTGDKRDDIVLVTNSWNHSPDDLMVLVYRQAPDGTLLAPLRYPHNPNFYKIEAATFRHGLALGHLNGDEVLDIAVGDADGYTLLLSSPQGLVSTWVSTGRPAENVGILDVDMDGHADLFGQTWWDGATILYGDGTGAFPRRRDVATNGYGYNDLKVGDVNGDGTRDVLIASAQGYPDFSIYPVAPGGGWLPMIKIEFPYQWPNPEGGAIGDFNGDGVADIALSHTGNNWNPDNLPMINLFAGTGPGSFAAPLTLRTHDRAGSLEAGDIDGNGLSDLAVMHWGWKNVGYYLQGTDGLEAERLVPAPFSSHYPAPQGLTVGDVDSNGCLDIVVAEHTGVLVYRGRGCRRSPHDFDLDRRSDILWRNPATGANVVWKAADHTRTFDVMDVSNTAWQVVGQGDFDGDAKSDLVWRNTSNGANVIWRAGSNTAQIPLVGVYNPAWTVAGVGDFNGDGRADLFWRNAQTGQHVIWHSGNAATQTVLASVPDFAWRMVGIGDFDGDRRSDLLWRNSDTGANQVWRSGNSATQLAVTGVYNAAWTVQGVGDFDGDARSDIFWRNTVTGTNTIWRSASSAQQVAVMGVTSQSWRVVAVADYDADGRSDLLWRNTGNGANTIWRSADSSTQQAVGAVTNPQWKVVP